MKVDALQRYYNIHWLEFETKRWRAEDRLRAATLLRNDFYLSGFELKTIDPSKPRVDCQGFKQPSERRIEAENRFRSAIKIVPVDFWPMVRLVCLENKIFIGSKYERHTARADLCRGLDYLCDFYTRKKRA